MTDFKIKYLVPKKYLATWNEMIAQRVSCTMCVTSESLESNGDVYRKVRFQRSVEQIEALSLPGPRDRPAVFLLAIGLTQNGEYCVDQGSHAMFMEFQDALSSLEGSRIGE